MVLPLQIWLIRTQRNCSRPFAFCMMVLIRLPSIDAQAHAASAAHLTYSSGQITVDEG